MFHSGKKLCCVVFAIALLLTSAAPGFQGVAAADTDLLSGTRDTTPQADIYGLRNLIELSEGLDLLQVTAPQSDIAVFRRELADAKNVEQNAGASEYSINAAYNALGAAYAALTPIVDPEQVLVLRGGGIVFYDQVSVGLTADYRNVSQQYECLPYPYESLIRSIRWSSSNPDVSVSAEGVVAPTVNSPQYTQITVTVTTYDGREITNNPILNVSFAKIHTSGLTFEAESMTGYVGETGKIKYTLSPTLAGICTANIQDIIWESSSPEYVSVDADGTLHFNRASGPEIPGAVIFARAVDGGYSANCWVYVDYNRKALQQKINEANQLDQTLYTAASWQQMTAVLAQAVAVNEKDFYATSSQQEIDNATAALTNAMHALEPLATIDSIVITHNGSPAAKYNSVKVGTFASYSQQSFSLGISVTPSDAAYQSVTWSSSDSAMTVDQNGTVKPASNSAAAAKITVTVTDYNGRQFSDWVYVSFVKTQVTGITISSSSLSLDAGSSAALTCEVQPKPNIIGTGGPTIGTVIWESSDPSVATVDNGMVVAVDGGTATISCTTADGGFTATCSVSVTVDKTELNWVITNARTIDGTLFTPESYSALQNAIEAGAAVYFKEYAKIAEINGARDAILAAIDALQIRKADYTSVVQLISVFDALSPELYTPESYAAVQQAVSDVVFDLSYSEQARVDAMAQAINDAIVALEERSIPHLMPAQDSAAVVDETDHFVYGVLPGASDVLSLFTTTDGSSLSFTPTANGSGTGSTITMVDLYGNVAGTYTLIIFGDVNGDGWYNGSDAFFVSLAANGILTESVMTEARLMAADCNHDGAVDNADVTLLEQAGLMLSQVDQTLTQSELETNSAYTKYCSVIEQSFEAVESSAAELQDTPQTAANVSPFISDIFRRLIDFITKIFSVIAMPK